MADVAWPDIPVLRFSGVQSSDSFFIDPNHFLGEMWKVTKVCRMSRMVVIEEWSKEVGRMKVDEENVESVMVRRQVEKVLGELITKVRNRMEGEIRT